MYPRGSAGTGGASSSRCGFGELPRIGEGVLKVLSVIDPELFCRCNPPGRCTIPPALPSEEFEACRWTMRFVCSSPTGTGLVVYERSAAAAAALERLALEVRLARKAWTAAVDAAALGGVLAG